MIGTEEMKLYSELVEASEALNKIESLIRKNDTLKNDVNKAFLEILKFQLSLADTDEKICDFLNEVSEAQEKRPEIINELNNLYFEAKMKGQNCGKE